MKLIGRDILKEFIFEHADARSSISAWIAEVEATVWQSSHDVKARYANASFLGDGTVIFNIKGNTYRMETRITYKTPVVMVVWIGTHAEYSKR